MFHTAEELTELYKANIRKLHSDHLLDFYSKYLEVNVFIFNLSNGDSIKLFFDKEHFFHLIGFQYFYPSYSGLSGWNYLEKNPVKCNLLDFNKNSKTKMAVNRFKYFGLIPRLLNNPDIFIFESKDFPNFNYKSKYFAVMKHDKRYLKIGIGISNANVHYPETFLIDLQEPKYNAYIEPKYQIPINSIYIIPKSDFLTD